MFNMEKIGLKISELRKAKNMTQMELADIMNISFQAVSNWERGNTMPDISKIPELARIFGVTIDALLGETSHLFNSAANGNIEEYLENNSVSVGELSEIASVLKPEQVDSIFERTRPKSLSEISDLLPFIHRDVINQLARKAAEGEHYRDLDQIVCFIDKPVVDEIAVKLTAAGKSIAEIVPFISGNMITELAKTKYKERGLSSLEDMIPFVPKETLREIADQEYKAHGLQRFEPLAPFLDKAYLSELAKRAIEKEGIKAISPIVPFLDRNMLSEYVKERYL